MITTCHTLVDSPVGELTLVADAEALRGVYFRHHWYRPAAYALGDRVDVEDHAVLRRAALELEEYLAGRRQGFDVPTATDGDAFSERVWSLLREIRYGTTATYGALAERLGDRSLARDVGWSVGHNPLSIVVPCHRVVGAGGSLTGYAGGLARKRRLLDLEEPAEVTAQRLF